MDRYLILKNALVLTFDKDDNVGYYNIVIKNNIIHQIDYYNDLVSDRTIYTKYPGVNIIDAKDKIIIPALFNSNINSSYALSGVFFERINYDKLPDNLSLSLLDKYFTSSENKQDLKNLITFSYFRALSNGELFLNETSGYLSKDFLQEFHKYNFLIVQDIVMTSFSEAFSRYLNEIKKFHCIGMTDDEEITNYSLTSAAKALKEGRRKIYFDILKKSSGQEHIRRTFSKSIFKVLGENDFLDGRLIFSNPVNIQKDELDYLSDKKVNIILCPSDIVKLGEKKLESFELLKYGLNVSFGTGYLGTSIISEIKLCSHLAKKGNLSYRSLLKMAVVNPARMFDVSESHGSIEKNKIANLIMFDVSDLRNYFLSPDVSSEKVAEHIIENLDSKDISDIIIKGNVIRRDYRSKLFDIDTMKTNTSALTKKIIEIGKYYEFKEKYLMRKRIKELSTGGKEERKIIITTGPEESRFSSLKDNSVISESEFRVVATKKNVTPINTVEGDDDVFSNDFSVEEISNINEGIVMYDNVFFSSSESSMKNNPDYEIPKKKIFFDDVGGVSDSGTREDEIKLIGNKQDKKESQTKKDSGDKPVFKKDKLRFGFTDTDQ